MKQFAVFDIDGTLIRWQLYHAVVNKLAKNGLLAEDAHEKIHTARMRWKNRELGYGFSDYERTLIMEFESAILTLNPEQFQAVVNEVIGEYKNQVYTFTRDLITKLKAKKYQLIAISGSQQELVEAVAKSYGFDLYVGTTYKTTGGRFTGEKVFPAQDKKRALQNIIEQHGLTTKGSYGIGDSKSDARFLEMAENPIAFNPDSELLEIAKQKHWQIIIERKNVIYTLEYSGNEYKLRD